MKHKNMKLRITETYYCRTMINRPQVVELRSNFEKIQLCKTIEDCQSKQVDITTGDGEHHLQIMRYKSDETRNEREAEGDGRLMDWYIGKSEHKSTGKEYPMHDNGANMTKSSKS